MSSDIHVDTDTDMYYRSDMSTRTSLKVMLNEFALDFSTEVRLSAQGCLTGQCAYALHLALSHDPQCADLMIDGLH